MDTYVCMHACMRVCVCVCVCVLYTTRLITHITTLLQYPSAKSMCSTRSAIAHSALAFFFVSGGDRRQYVNALGTNSQKFSTLVHLQESHYREKLLRRCALRDILVSCVCVCVCVCVCEENC